MQQLKKWKQNAGFTLVEMIVAIVIMLLLTIFAMPSIQQSYQQFQLDAAIIQLHKDIRWAQRIAEQEQEKVSIMFFQDKQPYRYVIQKVNNNAYLKTVELPNNLTHIKAVKIFINPDKTFMKNGHVLIQKGEIQRYVYYYQTGRSRVSNVPD